MASDSDSDVPNYVKNRQEEEDSDSEEKEDDSDDEREYSDHHYDYGDNKDDTDLEELVIPTEDIEVQSLEKLCLKSITKNFERFNIAYKTTEDAALRRNLEFLQRAYSHHMISEMRGLINDSNLDFLLNEHLKELYAEMFCNCSEQAILKRVSEIGHSIVKGNLNPSRNPFEESHLVKFVVNFLPNVHVLYVRNICSDEILQSIASSCPKLQELYIEDSSVTDEGVRYLFKEKDGAFQAIFSLRVLSLTNTNVEATGLTFLLKNMPSLQLLNHNLVPLVLHTMHIDGVQKDTLKKYNLTTLDLMKYEHFVTIDLSDILSACAAMCPHVTELRTPIVTEKHLDMIPLFSKLEDLTLDFVGTSEIPLNLDSFVKLHGGKLKQLSLGCFSLSVPILLQGCPRLVDLTLRDVVFQWNDKDGTSDLPSLKHLRNLCLEHFIFDDNPIEDMSIEAILNSCPQLELLDIAHSEVTNTNIQTTINNFCAKSSLQSLHFRCSDVSSIMLECILLTCSSLRTLKIHDCDNMNQDHIDNLYHIIHSKRQKVDIIWSDHRSEFNSIAEDFFDHYDFSDESDDFYNDFYDYDPDYPYDPDYLYDIVTDDDI